MKQASMPDEACFMCQRSLLRWASKPISWLSGNLVGISINLCKSIQKELFINDTP